jgi:hypothetical protein
MAAAKIVLEPIFEADYDPASFGFRPKRSAQQALEVVRLAANQGRVHWGGRAGCAGRVASLIAVCIPLAIMSSYRAWWLPGPIARWKPLTCSPAEPYVPRTGTYIS